MDGLGLLQRPRLLFLVRKVLFAVPAFGPIVVAIFLL